ncbi:MAG: GumC family protein, partial [Beijerinckiaceae bacterium]|nr:GumC family protein [Beijerinckiaceae bacterium]
MSHPVDQREELDRLDLDEIKRFLKRRWKLIVATAVLCAVLAAVICLSLTPTYKATAQVLLDPRRQHVFGSDQAGNDSSLDSSVVDSQIPIILSTRLLAKVIDKEHLAEDPEFASTKQGLLDRIASLFRPAKPVNIDGPSFDGIDPKLVPVISHLFDKIDVQRVQKSYVLSISVSAKTAAKATRLADSIARIYVEDQVEVHSHALQQAADFFQDRLGSLRQQVHESEQAVADYRKAHGLTPVTDDRTTTVGQQQLQNLNEKLAQVSADTAARLAAYQQAKDFKARGSSLDSLPEIIRSPVINQLRTQQAELTRRAADLAAMYGPAFPAMAQIKAQRAGLDRAIAAEMTRLVSTTKNDYEVAKAREDSLRKSIAGLSETSGGDDDVGVRLRELERINLANRALFENFLNRAKLTQEQSSFEETDARVISPALEPTSPSFPKTKIIVAVAFVVGLILGLGLAMLLDRLRRTAPVRSSTARADAFILGRVPMIDGARGGPADGVAEALRHLEAHPGSPFARAVASLTDRIAPAAGTEGGRT